MIPGGLYVIGGLGIAAIAAGGYGMLEHAWRRRLALRSPWNLVTSLRPLRPSRRKKMLLLQNSRTVMKLLRSFLILPCLISLGACGSTSSVKVETRILVPNKQPPCAAASGGLATVGQIDQRRRGSESKLAACAAKVEAMNSEIDRLKALGAKGARS